MTTLLLFCIKMFLEAMPATRLVRRLEKFHRRKLEKLQEKEKYMKKAVSVELVVTTVTIFRR